MRINHHTQSVATIETEKGRKINIYPSSFNFPSDPFTTFWVAQDEDNNLGFLIDGKSLTFNELGTNEYEFIVFSSDLSWLENLRKFSPL